MLIDIPIQYMAGALVVFILLLWYINYLWGQIDELKHPVKETAEVKPSKKSTKENKKESKLPEPQFDD